MDTFHATVLNLHQPLGNLQDLMAEDSRAVRGAREEGRFIDRSGGPERRTKRQTH